MTRLLPTIHNQDQMILIHRVVMKNLIQKTIKTILLIVLAILQILKVKALKEPNQT